VRWETQVERGMQGEMELERDRAREVNREKVKEMGMER
jgi:hypothetical protein